MGVPTEFEGSNSVLGAPRGSENVESLPVFSNGTCCVSAWALSDEEIEEIVRTRRVFVSVMSGRTQPPVFVGGEEATRSLCADYGVWPRPR